MLVGLGINRSGQSQVTIANPRPILVSKYRSMTEVASGKVHAGPRAGRYTVVLLRRLTLSSKNQMVIRRRSIALSTAWLTVQPTLKPSGKPCLWSRLRSTRHASPIPPLWPPRRYRPAKQEPSLFAVPQSKNLSPFWGEVFFFML